MVGCSVFNCSWFLKNFGLEVGQPVFSLNLDIAFCHLEQVVEQTSLGIFLCK